MVPPSLMPIMVITDNKVYTDWCYLSHIIDDIINGDAQAIISPTGSRHPFDEQTKESFVNYMDMPRVVVNFDKSIIYILAGESKNLKEHLDFDLDFNIKKISYTSMLRLLLRVNRDLL